MNGCICIRNMRPIAPSRNTAALRYNDPLIHHRLSYRKGGGGIGKTTRVTELFRVRDPLIFTPPHLLVKYITVSSVGVGIMIGRPTSWTRGSSLVSMVPGRQHLRSAAGGKLIVPSCNTKTFGPRAFAVSCPSVWNALPDNLRALAANNSSLLSFRKKLKTHLFSSMLSRNSRSSS